MSADVLLTAAQVAERLGLTIAAVRMRSHRGTLPPKIRLGSRTIRWRAADIDAMIEEKTTMKNTDLNTQTMTIEYHDARTGKLLDRQVLSAAELATLAERCSGAQGAMVPMSEEDRQLAMDPTYRGKLNGVPIYSEEVQ